MIHSKRFATERAVDFISVLEADFFFPRFHFDVTKVSGVTDRTPEARLSFAYRSRKKFRWIAITFVTACIFLSLWTEILMTFCSVL